MDTKPTLSERTQEVLDIIMDNPGKTPVDIAALGGIALGQVTGAITTLKKHGMLEIDEGKYTATMEAEFEYGKANDVPAPASAIKALAASSEAADSADSDADADEQAQLAAVAAHLATPAPVEGESAPEAVVAAEDAPVVTSSEVVTTADTDTTAVADDAEEEAIIEVTSTLIPGRAPASVKPAAEPKQATESKASKARAIWEEMKDRPRKEIMARLTAEVGLTQHGANTYLYNFRKAAGMVKARDAEAVATPAAEDMAATTVVAAGDEPAFVPEAPEIENVVIDVTPEPVAEPVVAEAAAEEKEEAKVAE